MGFLKSFFASLLALIVAGFLLFVVFIVSIVGVMTSVMPSVESVEDNSVLVVSFKDGVVETATSPFGVIDINTMTVRSPTILYDALTAIHSAATDDCIKGIYINLKGGANAAIVEEIRGAIEEFKVSGKFVVAYSDSYSQMAYYFSSIADFIYLNPEGVLEWKGLSSSQFFYKELLDKMGVKPEIIRYGRYKSAVEPYMDAGMSRESREQATGLVDGLWSVIVSDVAKSRDIDVDKLRNYASNLSIVDPNAALKYGLIDGVAYEDQVLDIIALLASSDQGSNIVWQSYIAMILVDKSTKDVDDPAFIELSKYSQYKFSIGNPTSSNEVAVVYASGVIVDGDGDVEQIGGAALAKKLRKLRNDDNVKSVVLRINSPGGSALAAEIVWREMELLKAKKPIVVSMGAVAASGGYYIAAPADIIVVDKFTITGSIGVFGVMMNVSEGLEEHLGINVDIVNSERSADLGSPFRGMTSSERAFMQRQVDRVYKTFVGHVADGRNLTYENVDKIAEGRVWSGADALNVGLVDGYGGLMRAILLAADKAGLGEEFRVNQVFNVEDEFSTLLNSFFEVFSGVFSGGVTGSYQHYINSVDKLLKNQGVQALMPVDITLD